VGPASSSVSNREGAGESAEGRAILRRWSTASRLFALLAVASGIAAFAIVRGYAARLEALRPVVGRPIPVVIAAADLTRGTSIGASMVRVAPLPSMLAPPGSFPDATELEGRILLTDIAEGEAITPTRLAARSAGPVAALVEPGLRAAVVDSGLPPGAARPGDRVDVLATYGGERPHTETVASGLEVLRVMAPSPGAVGSGSEAPSLVLLVSPLDAERLAYAKAFADLDVSISTSAEIPSGATEAG
jgi:pilus assembly protein CpaB